MNFMEHETYFHIRLCDLWFEFEIMDKQLYP